MDTENHFPAFPVVAGTQVYATGMTIRDYFAGQAISGACSPAPDGWSLSPHDHAAWAYQIADAMMEARK